jgi:signal transduction histidine kinase
MLLRRVKHALTYSLRVKLMVLFVALALTMAAAFTFGMQAAFGASWRAVAKPLLTDYLDHLAADIGSPPSTERALALTQRLPLSVRIAGPQLNWRSHPQESELDWMYDDHSRGEGYKFFQRTTADGHRIQFGISVQAWNQKPRFIGWVTLATLMLLTWMAYKWVRRMLRPLDDIRAGALRFGVGNFAHSIPVQHAHRPDELGELAATINTMGADIHQMLEAKRTLLLAISHELRSPLTRARLNTELLPETTELQANREALLRDLALMRDLVSDLLESERLASPHVALHPEPVDLPALVREVVCELQTTHAQSDGSGAPSIDTVLPAAMLALSLDPIRMRLLVRNLLDNALRHSSQARAAPRIEVQPLPGGDVQISVRDFGPGVAEDQLPHLGQPFFRPDAARTREGGGVGLGLYLCRLVAQAHGGRFTVRNALPGLEIVVVLPGHSTVPTP